jgi:hypothetical protein
MFYTVETKMFPASTRRSVCDAIDDKLGLDYELTFEGVDNYSDFNVTVFDVENKEIKILQEIEKAFKAYSI